MPRIDWNKIKTKICFKCGEKKDITEFYKHKNRYDGLAVYCKKCEKKYHIKNKMNNPKKYWCQSSIRSHKSRGFEVLFNWEELLPIAKKTKTCQICNNLLDWKYYTGFNYNSPTLDRINNGHILNLSDVWIVCSKCNITKQDRTLKELINWCKLVVNKYGKN